MTTPPRGGGQNTAKRQKQWCEKLSTEEKSLLGICSFVVHQLGKDALKTSCLCCNCETRSKCAAVLCIFRVSQSHTNIYSTFSPLPSPGGNTEMRHWALMMQLQSYRRLPGKPGTHWLPSNPSNQGQPPLCLRLHLTRLQLEDLERAEENMHYYIDTYVYNIL